MPSVAAAGLDREMGMARMEWTISVTVGGIKADMPVGGENLERRQRRSGVRGAEEGK